MFEKTQLSSKETERRQRLKDSLPDMKGDFNPPSYVRIKMRSNDVWMKLIAVTLLGIAIFVFSCNFLLVRVDGHSMDPTLHSNFYFIAKKNEKPKRFDIVVLKEREKDNAPSKVIVKRVIGLPGDRVSVISGRLFVNNKEYKESYLDPANTKMFKKLNWTIQVPKDSVFVMGDNRDISKDSRIVGSFKIKAIMGVKI